jgi:hypothetical protein
MKKSFSLILAIALVFSMVTPMAFAAEKSAGEYLAEIGVIKGSLSGDLMENETWKRQDVTVILSRLLGAEDEAQKTAKSHTFADVTDPYYDGYISWGKENGYFQGHSEVRFGYNEEITMYDFLAVMLRALGVDTTGDNYANVPQLAVEYGLIDSADQDLSVAATRGEYYVVIVTTLNAEVEDGVTLGEKLGLPGFAPEEPDALEVEKASAPNLKQVVVEFNQDVTDNAEAAKADNYSVKDGKVVDVAVNGSTVTLTLEKAFTQQTTKVLTISDKVLGEKEEIDVRFFDTTVPEAVSAEVIGKNTIKVTFSEPINVDLLDTRTKKRDGFGLKDSEGKTVYVDDVTFAKNNTEANVSFYTTFKEGEYTLSVKSAYQDYAGFKVVEEDFTVDVVVDEAAPEIVGFKNAKPYGVTLIFNEDIVVLSKSKADFYHTNSKNQVDAVPTANGNELTLSFPADSKMPAGTVYVYVGGDAVSDLWDNKNKQQLRVEVEVVGDETPPVITKIEADGQSAVKVTFDEEVDEDSANNIENYKLIKADGKEDVDAIVTAARQSDKKVVKLTFNGPKSGDLTLEVDGVKDLYGNAVDELQFDFFMEDVTPFDETADAFKNGKLYNVDSDIQRVVINFGESMAVSGEYSVLDLSKYRLDSQPAGETLKKDGISINAIDNNEAVEIVNNKTKSGITFADGDDIKVAVSRIADAAGNKHPAFTGAATVTLSEVENVTLKSAKAVDKRTIEVELSEALEVFNDKDFFLTFDGTDDITVTDDAYSYQVDDSSDGKKIIFLLDVDMDTKGQLDGKPIIVKTKSDVKSTNVYGVKVKAGDSKTAADGIKPAITKVEKVDADTIKVTVSEEVYAADAALAAADLIITKSNGNALVAGTEYTVTIDDDADGAATTFLIELKVDAGNSVTVKTVDAPKYIKDKANNQLSKYNGAKVTLK